MRDTRLRCDCCDKYEGGCVRGVVNCPCETETTFVTPMALECPDCKKCPVHCKCDPCDCRNLSTPAMFFGHHKDCIVRRKCRVKIKKAKAEVDLMAADVLLKSLDKENETYCRRCGAKHKDGEMYICCM